MIPRFPLTSMDDGLDDSWMWCLQAQFVDHSESALFASRQEALEHAEALLKDYDGSVGMNLIDPWGGKETLRESPFMARDGTS